MLNWICGQKKLLSSFGYLIKSCTFKNYTIKTKKIFSFFWEFLFRSLLFHRFFFFHLHRSFPSYFTVLRNDDVTAEQIEANAIPVGLACFQKPSGTVISLPFCSAQCTRNCLNTSENTRFLFSQFFFSSPLSSSKKSEAFQKIPVMTLQPSDLTDWE